jgi:hypothetical protein
MIDHTCTGSNNNHSNNNEEEAAARTTTTTTTNGDFIVVDNVKKEEEGGGGGGEYTGNITCNKNPKLSSLFPILLPMDVVPMILSYCPFSALINLRTVSKKFRDECVSKVRPNK